MPVVARRAEGFRRVRSVTRAWMLGALAGLFAVASCGGGGPGPAATTVPPTSGPQGNLPPSNVPQCVRTTSAIPLDSIPQDFYQDRDKVTAATVPGDVICANQIAGPDGYGAWVFLYWVKQANGRFVEVSATIRIKTTVSVPRGGRPILSWAHGTPPGGTVDACAPSLALPRPSTASYGPYPLVPSFLDAGFAVVATDYIGLGMPGAHPYLVGKSEGAAVLAAARAAQNFRPVEATGPVIIAGHSQGGHAALWAGYQAQNTSYFAPGIDVRGVIALSPPTHLDEIASDVIADRTDFAATLNILIAAGSWHQLYKLDYPPVLTKDGVSVAQAVTDPTVRPDPKVPCAAPAWTNPKTWIRKAVLPADWTARLVMNSAPAAFLTMPLLVVQGTNDKQVPYDVTLAAMRDACADGVPVTFKTITDGDHTAPLTDPTQLQYELWWAQQRISGESVEDSCGSLPGG
jgi:fermentation-respiration switch protein FrsA (DUF1100 family)